MARAAKTWASMTQAERQANEKVGGNYQGWKYVNIQGKRQRVAVTRSLGQVSANGNGISQAYYEAGEQRRTQGDTEGKGNFKAKSGREYNNAVNNAGRKSKRRYTNEGRVAVTL